tara:strand:- start:478 stop:1629 length:1152 start_codon:yes stop_codon:yes gene_type:complete
MKNKIKYIIITPFFPSVNNHVGSYIYDQARAIDNCNKYEVEIIKLINLNSYESNYVFNGINVYTFKLFDFPFFIFPGIFSFINNSRFKSFFRKNFNINKEECIVHSHVCYPAVYLANSISDVYNTIIIAQHHGLDVLQLSNCRFYFFRKFYSNFLIYKSINELNKVDHNVFVSKKVRDTLLAYENYKSKNNFILYNGVDRTKFFKKDKIKNNDLYIIGCIANFWKIKDHISLIIAIEMLVNEGFKDIRLILIGKGETLLTCKQYVIDKNLSKYISFENERPHHELNKFYNQIDLFVLPSYYEALGCVLLEAWATETVILSVKNQGASEIIPENEHHNLLVDEQSPISLKGKIINEYNKRRKFKFDQKYDINNTVKEFLDYIAN